MLSVLIKPSSSLCNMRCAYCFYHDEAQNRDVASNGIMSDETAESLIRKAFAESDDGVFFAFQGGEPTLAGLDFFEKFVSKVNEVNVKKAPVVYTIQTNGLNIDQKWALFFRQNRFLVGLSCDGDKTVHDLLRTDTANKGTYKRVIAAAECLKKHRVEFNILTVVTKKVAQNIKKVYRSFKKHGFDYIQFIPCLAPIGSCEDAPHVPDNEDYYRFLSVLFEEWYEELREGKYRSIRYFDNLYFIFKGDRAEQCGMQGRCCIQFVIESNGDVYPCDFYCLDDFLLGNINQSSFGELAQSDKAKEFLAFSEKRDECKGCEYEKYCLSGCRRYRDSGSYRYCDASRRFYPAMLEKMPSIDRIVRNGYAKM